MYIVSGTFREAPQQTHRWNNLRLNPSQVDGLVDDMKVFCSGARFAKIGWKFKIPLFHIPIFGGWKDYVVLQPDDDNQHWHIGWLTCDIVGISRIRVRGPIRVLLGPEDVSFFGVSADGDQIKLREVARGRIGNGGHYAKTPLL